MLGYFLQSKTTPVLCVKLGVTVVLMFSFAIFVMPPLYDLFCDITGLNGKTGGPFVVEGDVVEGNAVEDNAVKNSSTEKNAAGASTTSLSDAGIDTSRTIKVRFIAMNNASMPWEFRPVVKVVEVHPGESTVINYYAHNPTEQDMTAQAVPSLSPSKAVNYFHKTECFCFNQQPLKAGESAELGLSFIVDHDIPSYVNNITLMYTLFDITDKQKNASAKIETMHTTMYIASNFSVAYGPITQSFYGDDNGR